MKQHLILPIIGCTILCAGCISTRYNNTDAAATLNYLYDSSDKNLANLSKSYKSTLEEMLKDGDVKPGLCADFGVVLAKRNRPEEANKWFNRETTLYPTSAEYVYYLKKSLIPEFADDTSIFSMAKAKAAQNSNSTSIDSLTTAPRSEMSNRERRQAARERNKAVKAKEKAERNPMKKAKNDAKPEDESKSKKK